MTQTSEWRGRPHLVARGDWHRRLHGPWRMLLQDVRTTQVVIADPTDYIEAAIRALIQANPFPMRMTRAVVVDDDGWIAFGYSTDPAFISTEGHDCWMGCEIGFAMAESTGLIEPVDLAIWEGYAREISDSEDWWT